MLEKFWNRWSCLFLIIQAAGLHSIYSFQKEIGGVNPLWGWTWPVRFQKIILCFFNTGWGKKIHVFKSVPVDLCVYLCKTIPLLNEHTPVETEGMSKNKTKRRIQLGYTSETSLVAGKEDK